MVPRRILVIGLDGFELALAERFMDQGGLPNIARLRTEGACYELDHGRDKFSGLTWEHFSSGKAPSEGGRWSAVTFDRKTYAARQKSTSARPFMADLSARTVVFDLPYCDLSQAPHVRGVTNWGAHDPGVKAASHPDGIHEELGSLFGPYPAKRWIYGFCWPSADKAQAAGDALSQAVEVRARAARWLLGDRFPDWDLGVVVVSESHSATEPLWHGVDPQHPLHAVESAVAAANGLRKVYDAIDKLVGDLRESFADATMLVVAMHGMGPNDSDVPAMVLIPELLYRAAFGSPYMSAVACSGSTEDGTPLLAKDASWDEVMLHSIPRVESPPRFSDRVVRRILGGIGSGVGRSAPSGIEWMPAARYSHFWPRMPAFALPSFYDGRIRINVRGREAQGVVPAGEYAKVCKQMIELLNQCRNLLTGQEVIADVHWPKQDPYAVGESEADLYVVWQSAPLGLSHPRLGSIGPIPFRRTGGHTGARGFLYVTGKYVEPGDRGLASSFDVVPTILDLLGERKAPGISGASLLSGLGVRQNIEA